MRDPLRALLAISIVSCLLAAPLARGQTAEEPIEAGFLSKTELGVARWLEEHPEWDGRGVTVCVIDTGIDLLHPALQTLPGGGPKLAGYFNGTDGGEVDTSRVARPEADGRLLGLSGRALDLGGLASDDGTFRIGVIRSADFLPPGLHARIVEQRKERGAPGADPVFDVVVVEKGKEWYVVVDTDEDGELADERSIRPFARHREVASFPEEVHLGFGVAVLDEGNRTVLLFDGGGHGTHVAGIIGGWYGEGHPLNGLAPGAKLLAAVCGNVRMGNVTSHNSIMKCIDWACANGADVINISFGGKSFFDDGREITAAFLDEAVRKWGVPIVLSAGNDGPALFTVGSPGTAARAFTIGAWAPATTQESNYGVVRPRRGDLFDFSSRGPLASGRVGVDFLAPGAAHSTLPSWHLTKFENWHGTSMAAPQATAAIALVLSGARAVGLPTTEPWIRRALIEGAKPVDHLLPLEQGHGLIRVPETFAALERLALEEEPIVWRLSADGGRSDGGLLVRGLSEGASLPFRRSIEVRPDLPAAGTVEGAAKRRADFERLLRLETDAPWLAAPRGLAMNAGGRSIAVEIDPARLEPGLSFAWVLARCARTGREEFRIPVTVIVPDRAAGPTWRIEREFEPGPGDRISWWVEVPAGATRLRYSLLESEPAGNVYSLALGAVTPWTGAELTWSTRAATVADEEKRWERAVTGGELVEVCAFSRWQGNRKTRVRLAVEFFGAQGPSRVTALPGHAGVHWTLGATIRPVRARVAGRITHRLVEIPLAWRIDPDPRVATVLDGEPMFLGRGTGSFEVEAGGRVALDLRRDAPFADWLDDSFVEVFDANDRRIAGGMFWDGDFEFELPRAGRYRLEVVQSARGRGMLERAGVLSPVLVVPIGAKDLTAHRSAVDAWPGSSRPEAGLELERQAKAAPYLLLPDTGPGLFRGHLSLRDEDHDVELLRAELVVDRRPAADDPAAARARLVRALRAEIDHCLADRRLDGDEVERAGAALAPYLLLESSEEERDRVRVELDLAAPAPAEEALARVRETAARWAVSGADPERLDPAARSRRVQAHLWSARAALAAADLAAAARETAQALLLDPGARTLEVDLAIALALGEKEKALEHARALAGGSIEPRWARRVVDLEIELGHLDRAAAELATWTRRFPRRQDEALDLAREIQRRRTRTAAED